MSLKLGFSSFIQQAVDLSTIPQYLSVPTCPEPFFEHTSTFKIVKKFLHKYLFLKLTGQFPLWQEVIPKNAQILWIYRKRNFGDAIMDLSGRKLLKDLGIKIDLFTFPHFESLFKGDDIFNNIYTQISEIDKDKYTHVIISEFNLQSIRVKVRYFKNKPFACLFGFFYGPDKNQTIFSYFGINRIFKFDYPSEKILSLSKPYLTNLRSKNNLLGSDEVGGIAICVGGIEKRRTFNSWFEVLELIDKDHRLPKFIYLLGSQNGVEMANEIRKRKFNRLNIKFFVNQLSLLESRQIIMDSSLYVGCDGGLLHVAHTTDTPSVSIFGGEPPELRLTELCHSLPVCGDGSVNLIPSQLIYESIKTKLGTV